MLNSRKITVLQVIPGLEAGGAERATVDVAHATLAAGHRAIVVSSGGRLQQELKAQHILHNVASKNIFNIIANAFWLAALIKKEKIDIVHARSRAPAWSAYLATRMTGTPFVTTFHAAYKGTFFLKKFYNSVMAKSDHIIAISHFIARHIQKNYGVDASRIAVIPRGIDMQVYDADAISEERKNALKTLWNNKSAPIIIMPGRLSPIKGHELVLQALRSVTQDFICVFIGPDQGRAKYSEKLRELVNAYGLQDKIIWMNGGDVPAAYALAQLVLSPSQVAEGFGRVPVEAQASGVPVIATALGATDETIVDGETGWLVPAGDATALGYAIAKGLALSPDEHAQMAQKAKAYVRIKFQLQQMCDATLEVYKKVAKP
ncbi:MAG: glycosyltransferase [Alphaproteobacteria bacterium]|nr:glycosyltransferase [Alphaproteobacteria bacterium]